jgi:DNA-binding FadR family transcriptional regulator
MRKPISKHALRRAMERVKKDGFLSWEHPAGTVVDRIWHELGKSTYKAGRKKPLARDTVRKAAAPEVEETISS